MNKSVNAIPSNPAQPCWCGSHRPYRDCHSAIDQHLESLRHAGAEVPDRSLLKTEEQIAGIRRSAKVNIDVLDYVQERIKEGITTEEIDRWAYEQTTRTGAIPAPLNYEGYPKSVCTSIDEVVCHGIPSRDRVLKEGDIINVDCSTILNGYFSDSSRMFVIGRTTPEKQKLVDVTRQCVYAGLEEVKPWNTLGDMSHVIKTMARSNGFSVVREIGGHGCGLEFHEEPFVSYVLRKGTGMVMVPGMVFTIEPMINMGVARVTVDRKDGWTVRTADGKPSAQWELQVLVTHDGHEILSY